MIYPRDCLHLTINNIYNFIQIVILFRNYLNKYSIYFILNNLKFVFSI